MTTAPTADQGSSPRWRDLLSGGRGPLLALIMLGDWLVAADSLATATLMPSVGQSLSGFAWFGWTASGFLTGSVVAGASAGWMSERFGLRASMVLAGLLLAFGCALSALTPDMFWFVVSRVLQGIAGGWLIGLIYVAMATSFPAAHLPRLFALVTSVWGIATFVGPLIGGAFADWGWWRGVFWLFAGQALLFAVAALRLIPARASDTGKQRVPIVPLVLLTLAIAAVSAAGVVASAWVAAPVLAGGIVLLVIAVRGDIRGGSGILPAQVSDPGSALRAAYIVYFMACAAGVAFALYGPALLHATMGLSALEAGYCVAIEAIAWTAIALAVSGSGDAWRRRYIVIGVASILLGITMQTFVLGGTSLPAILVSGALLGGGFGFCSAFLGQRIMMMLDPSESARGSGAIAAVRGAGGALGAAVSSIGANAAGFATGIDSDSAPLVALGAFGIGIPFALWALVAAIRVVRSPSPYAATATAAA
ncbi:MFS transporter [Sphingomonas sp. G-3-2-10]|uniref:MFS transporter n=1 Tax=Sphingomonas sp. G-3-2-10 TaxID=2728838 RepID=UPI00146AB813|nr:MFS transporter [Sphingomonas sp. G-3-2-10]